MVIASEVKPHMRVIGADGVHVGTVDALEGDRIKLTKSDSRRGSHQGHHHYIPVGIVAEVEDDQLRLSATAANAMLFREEADGSELQSRNSAPEGASTDREHAWKARRQDGTPDVNWSKLGLAAAAIGAAGAAALAATKSRRNGSADARSRQNADFELRLQTDENIRLISSSKVENTPVVGRDGERLGTIKSFMVDKYTGRVAYAVLSFGGTFGFGSSLFPLPWSMLHYDVEKDGYRLDITKEQLSNAPRFEASNEPEFDAPYRQRVLLFHRRAYA